MVMAGGMLVLGIIAAANIAAGQTDPKVDPFVPDLQAVLAALGAGDYLLDLCEVGTALVVERALLNSLLDPGRDAYFSCLVCLHCPSCCSKMEYGDSGGIEIFHQL
jgi:hypothetical protein